ncbi:hypothetical protein [Pseudonocardia sp.]|uniref:hypothetical protein n=1 Tax=Pseudonocardia sp. TaxID=60912 RepID=UPI002620F019|nr:hypothetical protein [Pseudonocardia sp.]
MLDSVIATSDEPMGPDQYRFVATDAWWLGSFGAHQHLTEHRLRIWIPARPERDWMLDRELTGRQRWLTGSAERARDDGFELHDVAPTGVFRAPYGEFHAARDAGIDEADGCVEPVRRRRGSWQAPTAEFLARLPRDPVALLARLEADHPGRWTSPFSSAVDALRTCLVPAELRGVLYRALTGLHGVHLEPEPVEVGDRACLVLVHDAGRTRTELRIDKADGQFAGERDTLRTDSRCGLPAHTLIGETAVHTAVVDELGVHPPG